MSVGGQFLTSVILGKNLTAFRDVAPDYFIEDERAMYNFVRRHVRRHGRLPSKQAMLSQGMKLPRARDTVTYYNEQLRHRHGYTAVQELHPRYLEAIRTRDMEGMLTVLTEMTHSLRPLVSPNQYSSIRQELREVMEDYEYAKRHPGLRGITYGYPTLDEITLGLVQGDLSITAGRPGMGKSWHILKHALAAWLDGRRGVFISMEMTLIQLARRWIALHTGINPKLIRKGELSVWAENRLRHAVREMHGMTGNMVFVAGNMAKSIDDVQRAIEEAEAEVCYIDAAYFLQPELRKKGYVSKWEQISGLTQGLKQLSTATVPIDITVQLNRNVRSNQEGEPDSNDVAGGDSFSQDSTFIQGMRRGRPPHAKTRRICNVIKAREGEQTTYAHNFQMYPVNMDECEYAEPEPEPEEESPENRRNRRRENDRSTRWML